MFQHPTFRTAARGLCVILFALTLSIPAALAGPMGEPGPGGDLMGTAEREIARRQQLLNDARAEIALGDKASREKDYEQAVGHYRRAFEMLPDSDVTADVRNEALDKYCAASMRLAEQRIMEGEYDKAKAICEEVLKFNPGYRPAYMLLAHLEDPDYFNKTITPEYAADVEQVKQLLIDTDGLIRSGQFDEAFKRTEQILNIDPYNKAARRFQEAIHNESMAYGKDAYNTARAKMLDKVQQAWAPPVNPFLGAGPGGVGRPEPLPGESGVAVNNRKLDTIILPKIEFRDATVREAIDFLKQESIKRDDTNLGGRKGINIVLNLETGASSGPAAVAPDAGATIPGVEPGAAAPEAGAGGGGVDPNNIRITVELANIPLREALKYVTNLGGLKFKVEPYAVLVVPVSSNIEDLITQTFSVPPTFMTSGVQAKPTPGAEAAAVGEPAAAGSSPRAILETAGVLFPPGSSARYDANTSTLTVKNTQSSLDLIEEMVTTLSNQKPRQVTIESKFVEVTQNDLKEVSFDWTVGRFNIGGSARSFAGGGTDGPTRTEGASSGFGTDSTNFPFTEEGTTTVVGSDLVTGGLRSGAGSLGAISANAIDSLLFSTPSGLAPGIMSVAGVFTDPQFQLVVRALDQKKGVDLLSSPSVTTRSGQRAVIEIIREFRYPTEFEAPQVPQEIQLGSGNVAPIVAPTTPTTFETRNTGVTLEVEPTVGPDGYTIELNLIPQVVEFEGFINYGSPINAVNILTNNATALTDNVINQPIFSTRKVQTSVTIWDGQTVVLGGLMREDVQKVEDKVPVLGDVPLLGRMFRSSVDQHIKKNLIIFVTARLIDPAGQPILSDEGPDQPAEEEPPGAGVGTDLPLP